MFRRWVDVGKLPISSEPIVIDAQTFQEMLDEAQPGDVIKIGPCVIEGNFVTKNDGQLDRPIVVFSDGNTILRPPPDGGGPILLIQNSNYVFDGFEFDMAGRPGYAVQVFQTDNVQLSNNRIHGARDCSGSGSAAGGVHIRGNRGKAVVGVRIRDNEIYENFAFGAGPSAGQVSACATLDWADLSQVQCDALRDGPQQDANGVYMDHFVQCVDIRRNEIYNNGGDGIQCEATETAGRTSFGIVVADNRIYTDTPCSDCGGACRGWTENAIDFKNCHQIRVTSRLLKNPAFPRSAGIDPIRSLP